MNYLFADFKFSVNEKFSYLMENAKEYLSSFENADFSIEISPEDLEYERSFAEAQYSDAYVEYIAVLRKIGELLPSQDAFVLHSACFDVEGIGVAFAAKSGTGKTTHLNRWKSYLGDKMTVVNGDKPIIRFFENQPLPIAYGTPWCGKEKLGNNTKTTLKHICFIERSENNFVESIDKKAAVDRIFNQVYMPRTGSIATLKTMELIERLISETQLWIIHCNMSSDAGEIAYKHIFE